TRGASAADTGRTSPAGAAAVVGRNAGPDSTHHHDTAIATSRTAATALLGVTAGIVAQAGAGRRRSSVLGVRPRPWAGREGATSRPPSLLRAMIPRAPCRIRQSDSSDGRRRHPRAVPVDPSPGKTPRRYPRPADDRA